MVVYINEKSSHESPRIYGKRRFELISEHSSESVTRAHVQLLLISEHSERELCPVLGAAAHQSRRLSFLPCQPECQIQDLMEKQHINQITREDKPSSSNLEAALSSATSNSKHHHYNTSECPACLQASALKLRQISAVKRLHLMRQTENEQ
jgi:hypothetical protein